MKTGSNGDCDGCWCDSTCLGYGDCCHDYEDYCCGDYVWKDDCYEYDYEVYNWDYEYKKDYEYYYEYDFDYEEYKYEYDWDYDYDYDYDFDPSGNKPVS